MFSVTDRGPGIPDDVQDKVFDWFETHSLGSRHRGTGLGLSLVRSFVELHGGSVTLESAVGRGTTITCVFPNVGEVFRTSKRTNFAFEGGGTNQTSSCLRW